MFKKRKNSKTSSSSKPRVLAVDDEEIIGYLIKRIVDHLGYDMDWVTSCEEALVCIDSRSYDVILSDFKFPNMKGDVFYREVAARNESLLDKLIFITGDTLNKQTINFLEEIDVPYLEKPFNVDELKELIQKTAVHSRKCNS